MFVFDPLTQGLELLAQRELQRAERLFLRIINDPYAQSEDLELARKYLNDIRSCQSGAKSLDFDFYKKLARRPTVSLDSVHELLISVYFSPISAYHEFDQEISARVASVISRLKQIKIRDIIARDELFDSLEKETARHIKEKLRGAQSGEDGTSPGFDPYRWKTIFRKFIQQINPILLERHLEMLEHVMETGNIGMLDDGKLQILTPKYRWIIESTLKSKWYLLRSYFFKARSEAQEQFGKKEGTRKYWEEVKYRKIQIFEQCGFHERNIQKFLYIDKLNFKTLEEIHVYAKSLGLALIPRDVSLALRGVKKAKDHIKERAGFLQGARKEFQDLLLAQGFSNANAYKIARQAKRANNHQILESFKLSLKVARDEIYWYRVPPNSAKFKNDIEVQCCRHLSTARIHLFDRGRLNKLLLQAGKPMLRDYLIKVYGADVVSLHCYFRIETIHQYYKLKFFGYHAQRLPSVSELIKISRQEFQPLVLEGYANFLKKKRLAIPQSVYDETAESRSVTEWEDPCTTPEEKILLKFWFLMDHGVSITQGLINKGILNASADLLGYLDHQGTECNS
ncbi:MAG: hypothetical protein HZA02_08715 [Nitrospinae bacterium]|nr:hypothetical protein [Nitrospinota bacterium]